MVRRISDEVGEAGSSLARLYDRELLRNGMVNYGRTVTNADTRDLKFYDVKYARYIYIYW